MDLGCGRAARVGDDDREGTRRWQDAVARGFLDGEPTEVQYTESFAHNGYRRKVGVYDDGGVQADNFLLYTISPAHRRINSSRQSARIELL